MRLINFSRRRFLRAGLVVMLVAQFTLLSVLPVSASGSADYSFASGAFRKVWEKPDFPVAAGRATRSFTWGPEGWAFLEEPYAEAPNGKRLVQYFDKTRMEITKPDADKNSPYYVTNGLLVKEMVTGQVQEGDNKFRAVAPSEVPVAGDPSGNPGPTYRSFQGVINQPAQRISGQVVKTTIDLSGKTGESDDLANKYPVKYLEFNPELSHNIPDVFWNFMNQKGTIYQNGQFVNNSPVIDWVSTMGFPLTEAYWSKVTVAGQSKDVLIQLYERRVLTYTPDNSDAYKVEMGNVGAHYYSWRYPNQPKVADWAEFKVVNDTSCNPVTVALTGQDNFTIEVPAKVTSKNYKLGPGDYTYKATGCGATPLEKNFSIKAGDEFTLTLYYA